MTNILEVGFLGSLKEAHFGSWMKTDRDEWLQECNTLIDPLMKLGFYDELYQNRDALLCEFKQNSLKGYLNNLNNVISNIKFAAQNLDDTTKDIGRRETNTSE